jgi:hypothetical protein
MILKDLPNPADLLPVPVQGGFGFERLLGYGATGEGFVRLLVLAPSTSGSYPVDELAMRTWLRQADADKRNDLAHRFAARARDRFGVQTLYSAASDDELRITVVLPELDIDQELALRAAFLDLARELPDSSSARLSVVVAGDSDATGEDLGQPL